jgi:SSS family solute:Na+ symporter
VGVLGFGVDKLLGIHFIHLMGVMFVVEMFILVALRHYRARSEPYVMQASPRPMDLTPWRHASSFSMVLMALLVSIYVTFSPIGVANAAGPSAIYVPLLTAVWIITFIIIGVLRARQNKGLVSSASVLKGV